jgi:hypothetical protein
MTHICKKFGFQPDGFEGGVAGLLKFFLILFLFCYIAENFRNADDIAFIIFNR